MKASSVREKLSGLSAALQPRLEPSGKLVSLTVVGSAVRGRMTDKSDLDLLVVTSDYPRTEAVDSIGKALRAGLIASFPGEQLVILDSPSQDRPDLLTDRAWRVQVILHRREWVVRSIKQRNWVFMNWAHKHLVLLGSDLLQPSASPELNASIVDEFDGLPAVLRRLDAAILVADPDRHAPYLRKLAGYANARLKDLASTFPELCGIDPPSLADHEPLMQTVGATRDCLIKGILLVNRALGLSPHP